MGLTTELIHRNRLGRPLGRGCEGPNTGGHPLGWSENCAVARAKLLASLAAGHGRPDVPLPLGN